MDANICLLCAIAGMPKDRIKSAMNRGLGVSNSGASLEPLTVEGIFHGAAVVVDIMTENRLRCLSDVKHILTKVGGQVTPTNYLFTKTGIVSVKGPGADLDTVLEKALEVDGVQEVEEGGEDGEIVVLTEPGSLSAVAQGLRSMLEGNEVVSKGIEWVPNEDTLVDAPTGKIGEEFDKMIGQLEDYNDVVSVYTNVRGE